MNYKILFLAIGLMACFSSPILAKERQVKGKVTAFNKFPLHKVSIVSKNITQEILTDENGYFSFTCDEKEKVTFEANGFFPEKIKIADFAGKDSVNVNMRFKKGKKNIKIASEFGHINEDDLTYAIEHLEAGEDYSGYTTILEAIQGRVPGVTVGYNSINIRGAKTLNGGPVDALLVVDGTMVGFSTFVNTPPETVKSISVVKGAATARYGSRGMGGVIVVKTKTK